MYSRAKEMAIGLYYDNPSEVQNSSELRAVLGFMFQPKSEDDLEYVFNYANKYNHDVAKFDDTRCIYAYFRMSFPLLLSHMIAPYKFYSKMKLYMNQNPEFKAEIQRSGIMNYAFVEIYSNSYTYFHAPTENYKDFDLT